MTIQILLMAITAAHLVSSLPLSDGRAEAPIMIAYDFPGKGSAADWSDALPYYNRGNRYLNQQRFADAAADYRVAVSKYPYDPDFYINLGVALRKMEDYPAAEQAFKSALELNDKDWSAWEDLGNIYLKENRLPDTLSCYEHALKCNLPAQQRAALLADMEDIHKVLRNMGQEPLPGSQPNGKSAGQPHTKQVKRTSAPQKAPPGVKQQPIAAPQAVQQKTKDWGYE
jgi:tetratricopeptide (TPR) repeat protein